MRSAVAGATGAIGAPLVSQLVFQHAVAKPWDHNACPTEPPRVLRRFGCSLSLYRSRGGPASSPARD